MIEKFRDLISTPIKVSYKDRSDYTPIENFILNPIVLALIVFLVTFQAFSLNDDPKPSASDAALSNAMIYFEKGDFDNILNCPLRAGDGSSEFRSAVSEVILPGLIAFQPELLFVSAGFDAHALDPLAGLNLQDSDYGWVTTKLMEIADKSTNGRLISALEGGYDLAALSSSVASHVEELVKA